MDICLRVLCVWFLALSMAYADQSGTFHLGVITERVDEPAHALTQYSGLRDYLAAALQPQGIQVGPLVIAQDAPSMADYVQTQQVDALLEGVFPSLRIQQLTGQLQPTLLAWRKGQRQYHSVFFSRRGGPVTELADLQGRRLVFEAPRSTSAYAMPRGYLQQQGFMLVPDEQANPPADAIRYLFSGAEVNQAYWVLYDKADAGAFNNGDWERLAPGVQEQLQIFAHTPPVLRWLWSFHEDTDPTIQATVTAVLLEMHQDPHAQAALQAASDIRRFETLNAEDRANIANWRDTLLVEAP